MKPYIGKEKIIMTLTLAVTGVCGAKIIQGVSIIKYAVFWYLKGLDSELALEIEKYVFPKLLCTSICSLGAGIFVVVSFLAGIALLRKPKTSNHKNLIILIAAVLLIVLCSVLTVKYARDIRRQPSFLIQEDRSDLWEEYQIHIAPKVLPIALFSLLSGVFGAVFFKFLKDIGEPPPTEPPRIEKPLPTEPPKAEKPSKPKSYDLSALKMRLATGEITVEEYEDIKAELEKD